MFTTCYSRTSFSPHTLPARVQMILATNSFHFHKQFYEARVCNAYAVFFSYVMYGLCLDRQYAAFTSSFRQPILCTRCPQRVGHFVFDTRVGSKLYQIRGPDFSEFQCLGRGSEFKSGYFVWWLSVRCGQRTESLLPLCGRVYRHKFHTFFCRPRASLGTTNSFSTATNDSSLGRAAFHVPPAAHIGTSD